MPVKRSVAREKMNPCVIPTQAVDVVGDGRWESMVGYAKKNHFSFV